MNNANTTPPPSPFERRLTAYYAATASEPPDVAQRAWRQVAPWLAATAEGDGSMSPNPSPGIGLSCDTPLAPQQPVTRWRPIALRSVQAIAAVLLLAALMFVTLAKFHAQPGQTAPPTMTQATLRDISMDAPDDGWAIGAQAQVTLVQDAQPDASTNGATADGGLLYHYTHGSWRPVDISQLLPPLRNASGAQVIYGPELNSISMDSPTDGWAVGNGVFLHYDGRNWQRAPLADDGKFTAVKMLAPDDGWAISGDPSQSVALQDLSNIYHYDGQTWREQSLPAEVARGAHNLLHLTMISADEGWIVGYRLLAAPTDETAPTQGFILHYLHGAWTTQTTAPNVRLSSVALVSDEEGWAAGVSVTDQRLVLLHYQHGSWSNAAIASPPLLGYAAKVAVQMNGAADGWLSINEDFSPEFAGEDKPTWLHYDGHAWQPAPQTFDQRFAYVSFNSGTFTQGDGWAVGSAIWQPRYDLTRPGLPGSVVKMTPVILRYHDGTWSLSGS